MIEGYRDRTNGMSSESSRLLGLTYLKAERDLRCNSNSGMTSTRRCTRPVGHVGPHMEHWHYEGTHRGEAHTEKDVYATWFGAP